MKNKNQIFNTVKVIILASILAVGIQYVSAQSWSAPAGSPPSNNTYAPLNVGTTGQVKDGGLTLGYSNTTQNALLVKYGRVGLGTTDLTSAVSRLTVANDADAENTRFDSGLAGSYVRVKSASGSNLLGIEGAGAWVGPTGSTPLNFKVADTVVGKFGTSGNLELVNQLKVAGGSPGSGKVLTSDADGLATWQTLNQSIQPSYSAPQSVISLGASDTSLGQSPWTGNLNTYTASCPSGKLLVSCSGGVVRRQQQVGITTDRGTIIVPNTSTNQCKMYTTEVGTLTGTPDTAVRLYAMCI